MSRLDNTMRELLEGRHYATLATHNEDGSIHLTPVWYLFDNDKFYVELPSLSRKARNVANNSNATILVDTRQPGIESWVYAIGRVEILRGEEAQQINSKIKQRYLTEQAIRDPRIGPAMAAGDDISICIIPEIWRSYSSKAVDERFFGGILSSTPERWFLPVDN